LALYCLLCCSLHWLFCCFLCFSVCFSICCCCSPSTPLPAPRYPQGSTPRFDTTCFDANHSATWSDATCSATCFDTTCFDVNHSAMNAWKMKTTENYFECECECLEDENNRKPLWLLSLLLWLLALILALLLCYSLCYSFWWYLLCYSATHFDATCFAMLLSCLTASASAALLLLLLPLLLCYSPGCYLLCY
jgi:hypothetical protein